MGMEYHNRSPGCGLELKALVLLPGCCCKLWLKDGAIPHCKGAFLSEITELVGSDFNQFKKLSPVIPQCYI